MFVRIAGQSQATEDLLYLGITLPQDYFLFAFLLFQSMKSVCARCFRFVHKEMT